MTLAHATVRDDRERPSSAALVRGLIVVALLIYGALLGLAWWGAVRFLPDSLTIQMAGRSLEVADIHRRVIDNAAVILTILPLALWIESLVVGWEASSIRQLLLARTPSIKTDLAILVLGQARVLGLLGRVMMLGASMISGMWLHDLIKATTGLSIDPSPIPLALQVLVYFYVYTFFDYWTHRLDHTRYFWPLHRYHHSAEDFVMVTAARQHPAAFTPIFIINMPLAALGAPPMVMVYVNVLVTAVGFLIHSQMRSDWGWVGRWVLQSPRHHRLHHKLDMTEPTGHFSMAPIWDRLFGTWRGTADPMLAIGVAQPYRHGFWILPDLFRDYWHFWSGWVVKRRD